MKTPIYDFVDGYVKRKSVRFHMPGHKGKSFLGCEEYDITEIPGADTLYSANGIIDESERYASELFGTAHTFYSTEGSTLAIKAMLALAVMGIKKPKVLASRGAHKAFVYAAALLDIDVKWVFPEKAAHLCSTSVSAEEISKAIDLYPDVSAVYITSPDYLGNLCDVKEISKVCHKRGIPLLVDNAHGAYLNFLSPNLHPISQGADMCCDSAHKTLPALTGAAYLHISKNTLREYVDRARDVLSVFASTSPSYLILSSLDICNKYLSEGYSTKLKNTVLKIEKIKKEIFQLGFEIVDSEPLKIVLDANKSGYFGAEIAVCLSENNIEVEFFDDEFVVLMLTPENDDSDYKSLCIALSKLTQRASIKKENVMYRSPPKRVMSIREALFSKTELLPLSDAVGRVCAAPTVSCPPAVPVIVSGELIDSDSVELFKKYKIEKIEVVKND